MTEEKVDAFTKLYPAGFPKGQYFIAVKEMVIEKYEFRTEMGQLYKCNPLVY